MLPALDLPVNQVFAQEFMLQREGENVCTALYVAEVAAKMQMTTQIN